MGASGERSSALQRGHTPPSSRGWSSEKKWLLSVVVVGAAVVVAVAAVSISVASIRAHDDEQEELLALQNAWQLGGSRSLRMVLEEDRQERRVIAPLPGQKRKQPSSTKNNNNNKSFDKTTSTRNRNDDVLSDEEKSDFEGKDTHGNSKQGGSVKNVIKSLVEADTDELVSTKGGSKNIQSREQQIEPQTKNTNFKQLQSRERKIEPQSRGQKRQSEDTDTSSFRNPSNSKNKESSQARGSLTSGVASNTKTDNSGASVFGRQQQTSYDYSNSNKKKTNHGDSSNMITASGNRQQTTHDDSNNNKNKKTNYGESSNRNAASVSRKQQTDFDDVGQTKYDSDSNKKKKTLDEPLDEFELDEPVRRSSTKVETHRGDSLLADDDEKRGVEDDGESIHDDEDEDEDDARDSNSKNNKVGETLESLVQESRLVGEGSKGDHMQDTAANDFDFVAAVRKYRQTDADEIIRSIPPECEGKERVVWFFLLTGIEVKPSLCSKLPHWNEITAIYGEEPVFAQDCGLDEPRSTMLTPRFSGLPGIGTGLLKRLLNWNVNGMAIKTKLKEEQSRIQSAQEGLFRHFMSWIIPDVPDEDHLRVIVAKDPYFWLQSFCYSTPEFVSYTPVAQMDLDGVGDSNTPSDRCPTLISRLDNGKYVSTSHLTVTSSDHMGHSQSEEFESLVHYWNRWMSGFLLDEEPDDGEAAQPYLVVRFEDILFHPVRVMEQVAQCSRTTVKEGNFKYAHTLTSKQRKRLQRRPKLELMDRAAELALVFYANGSGRTTGLTPADIRYVEKSIDPRIWQALRYRLPEKASGGSRENFSWDEEEERR